MILQTMLNRLHASLVHGPAMNARPRASRQRVDLMDLEAFKGAEIPRSLAELLREGSIEFPARIAPFVAPAYPEAEWSDEEKKAKADFEKQRRLLEKLRGIAADAQDYANDHGESALAIGFPLFCSPPSSGGGWSGGSVSATRVLAPICFAPVELKVRLGSRAGITLKCIGEGADLLIPNPALLAWLEQQTGVGAEEIFTDDEGADPWREINEILAYVAKASKLEQPPTFDAESLLAAVPDTDALPKVSAVLPCAVLGLFPLANQALLRDTQWMLENEAKLEGPAISFLRPAAIEGDSSADSELPEAQEFSPEQQATIQRRFDEEWLVTHADPCQSAAVRAARSSRALVIHGPPGTGKSQTIANIIGDHLARGQRVLFVCDKRTALDVVKYRLDALKLGHLCGIVHDPTHDRRSLYLQLRKQLDDLTETAPKTNAEAELAQANKQLQEVHAELTANRASLQLPGPDGQSFHDLLGALLELVGDETLPSPPASPTLRLEDVASHRTSLDEITRRAARAKYGSNPFRARLGIALGEFLARDLAQWRQQLGSLAEAAQQADSKFKDEFLALDPDAPLPAQAEARRELAAALHRLSETDCDGIAKRLSEAKPEELADIQRGLGMMQGQLQALGTDELEREVEIALQSAPPSLIEINQRVQALEAYLPLVSSWKRFFAGGAKKAAAGVLAALGVSLDAAGLERGLKNYRGLRARMLLSDFVRRITNSPAAAPWMSDADLRRRFSAVENTLKVQAVASQPTLASAVSPYLKAVLEDVPRWASNMIGNLRASAEWAEAVAKTEEHVAASGLFNQTGRNDLRKELEAGRGFALADGWRSAGPSLEDSVRLAAALNTLPAPLREATEHLAAEEAELEPAMASLRRLALDNALRERMRTEPALAAIDGERIEAAFSTFLQLSAYKEELVRDVARSHWLARQRHRMVSLTGTQLNKHGVALRNRLFVRGQKALKLRQMIATGAGQADGDPLFDLCPVWMASPSTVAQVFPRTSAFDVIIFDEASQCRLEEALPVLLRGERVVVAGDPKQLPPTRFFESSLTDSSQVDPETGEELFQLQQASTEDLLGAALNLEVHEAFLDVHYRSQSEALIGFSNNAFYHDRLQAIPGHPKNRALRAPILLHKIEGVYADRTNQKEADKVVELVAEMLQEKAPPSIGVACFNLTQRTLILETLDKRAETDPEFARKLEEAKQRRGRDSFEGLFVKNLENVQGDERDVIIISTTFGPDEKGKFRQNFGALSRQDGGRRLNVLVTRARIAIHVVTSIPRHAYLSIPAVEEGRQPTGRHHLYSYLRYAERLATVFEEHTDALEKMRRDSAPQLNVQETPTPSNVALSLGRTLHQRYGIGSTVQWGNAGFCVDVALSHPELPADVTLGVLTDFTRFRKTPDPIEWDGFRTVVLRSQGWQLQRLWSPALFRDASQILQGVAQQHATVASQAGVAVQGDSPIQPEGSQEMRGEEGSNKTDV